TRPNAAFAPSGEDDAESLAPAPARTPPATDRRIRILYVVFRAKPGGTALDLLSLLRRLDTSRFTPIVAIGVPGALAERIAALGVRVVPIRMRTSLRSARRPATALRSSFAYATSLADLAVLARSTGADLLHAIDGPALEYAGPAAKIVGVRAVATLPDTPLPPHGRLQRWAITWTARLFYERLVVPCEAHARLLRAAGIRDRRLAVLPTGIEVARFAAARAERDAARRALGVPADAFLVGTVGRLDPREEYDVLVRALALLGADHPEIVWVIVGDALFPEDAARRREIEAAVERTGLGERVRWTGRQDDVAPAITALDLLVH